MNCRKLCAALACATILAGCSINVPRDYDNEITSCSVSCPGKGRAKVSCNEPAVPACVCEPAPTSACVASSTRSM